MSRARFILGAVLALALVACGSGAKAPRYPTPAVDAALGVAFDASTGEASFRVWAPAARAASVLLFADSVSSTPTVTQPMRKDLVGGGDVDEDGWNGIWQATLSGVADGQLYQYSLDGARVLDPYAKSMGRFDSSSQSVGRGAVVDPAALKPFDLGTAGEPAQEMVPFTAPDGYSRREDAVIYEVHVRDFTIDVPAASLAHAPGSYLAFAERLDYVKGLGATHVQLLPVLACFHGDESARGVYEGARTTSGNNYDWGYDPQGWFAPEGMYSLDPTDPRRRVRELKTLVNEAHKRGLGVTLDVVYNHTANTSILDPLAPGYFYRTGSSSGTGNDTASERKMMRKLIVDSVAYLTREYRVDGFRFDLMGLIDSRTMLEAWAAASALNPHVLFIGEGWRMSGVPAKDYAGDAIVPANQDWMTATDDVAVFSDSYRDVIKGGGLNETSDTNAGFLTLLNPSKSTLFQNLRGKPTNFTADAPGDAVQYLTAHDGLTLHDKLGKILRLAPGSAEIPKIARLGFALQATSQGIAFIHGGCEFGRSKWVGGPMNEATPANSGSTYYVYNSYDASDAVNGFDWSLTAPGTEGLRLHDYVQGLLALRRSSDAFRLGDAALVGARMTLLDGSRANAIGYRVVDSAGATRFSVFVNAGTSPVALASVDDLSVAEVVVDGAQAGATPIVAPVGLVARTATRVTVAARTALVFRAAMP
jgi:secreted pullulanase